MKGCVLRQWNEQCNEYESGRKERRMKRNANEKVDRIGEGNEQFQEYENRQMERIVGRKGMKIDKVG